METDVIRDMTKRCKCCGNYFFATDVNKDRICESCANGNPPQVAATDSDWGDW